MYDWPEVQGRTDAFWAAVRTALPGDLVADPALARPADMSTAWRDPALVLGQTCGLPYVSGRCGDAVLVGRPVYAVPGAQSGTYTSALVVRADAPDRLGDFAGGRAAVNDPGSQSGHNALLDAVAGLSDEPFFGAVTYSGAHRNSAALVADSRADIAAIDAVAWALFAELEPERYGRLKVLAWTRPMPALPYVTAPAFAGRVPELLTALRAGAEAVSAPEVPVDVLPAADSDYDPIRGMARAIAGQSLTAA